MVYIRGSICKPPFFKVTPNNKKITELVIKVNRNDDYSEYIPAITWFYDAYEAREWALGDEVELYGRFQSREYHNGEKVTYEVSVSKVEKIFN